MRRPIGPGKCKTTLWLKNRTPMIFFPIFYVRYGMGLLDIGWSVSKWRRSGYTLVNLATLQSSIIVVLWWTVLAQKWQKNTKLRRSQTMLKFIMTAFVSGHLALNCLPLIVPSMLPGFHLMLKDVILSSDRGLWSLMSSTLPYMLRGISTSFTSHQTSGISYVCVLKPLII